MTRSLIAAALALPLLALPAQADKLVQIVIDHSGVLHDQHDPQNKSGFNSFVGTFLEDIARDHRRDRNDTRVVLISAVEPPHILWAGSAAEFYREGLRGPIVNQVVSGTPQGCNNLPDALAEVSANLRLDLPEESVVHIVTSGVHSGPDCSSLTQEGYVTLVETPDSGVMESVGALAGSVDSLSVHYLTAQQRRAWMDAIDWRRTGLALNAQGQN